MILKTAINLNIVIEKQKIRRLLKNTGESFISIKDASKILCLDKESTSNALSSLSNAGYIEPTNFDGLWQPSIRGRLILESKLKKEFKALTLKTQLNNLLKRIGLVKDSPEYSSFINVAIITSEFPIKNISEGIFVAYSLKSKEWPESIRNEADDTLRNQFKGSFNNLSDYYGYPHNAIKAFLKSSSPVLKIEEYALDKISQIKGYKLI